MPVYVYRNLQSGETFELQQRITESALSAHPQTGDPVKRLVQPVGIAFKGSGFYVNDSRKSSNSSNTNGKAESKSEGSKTENKTNETKSEKKKEMATASASS